MFTIYGPGINDPIRLEKLFVQGTVTKAGAISAKQAIDTKWPAKPTEQKHKERSSGAANRQYRAMADDELERPVLRAEQIMTSSVVAIQADADVPEAINVLEKGGFRHIPVLASDHQLIGMLSDRDVIRCVCGSGSACIHCSTDQKEILVQDIMTAPVLTTTIDTDARHIARLFVEQKVGAIPIMDGPKLTGIISRSDILRAVMHHFALELWA